MRAFESALRMGALISALVLTRHARGTAIVGTTRLAEDGASCAPYTFYAIVPNMSGFGSSAKA